MRGFKKFLIGFLGVVCTMYSVCFFVGSVMILIKGEFLRKDGLVWMIIAFILAVLLGLAAGKLFSKIRGRKDGTERQNEVARQQSISSVQQRAPLMGNATGQKNDTVPKATPSNVSQREMPQSALGGVRLITGQQVMEQMRILQDSLTIMEKTPDIDTFLSRYETAMRCVLTLEQAKKAGVPVALEPDFSTSLVSAKKEALKGVLCRSFKKELDEISKLKTANGRMNRINRYQEKLRGLYETEIQFVADEAYSDIMQKLDFLKNG